MEKRPMVSDRHVPERGLNRKQYNQLTTVLFREGTTLLSVGALDVPWLIDTSLQSLSLYMELCVSNHFLLSLINKPIPGVRILPEFRTLT